MNSVPPYHVLMLPLLKVMSEGKEMTTNQTKDAVAKYLGLTEEALVERLESGTQTTFDNRMGWARTYLFKAGLLDRPRRAIYVISDNGKKLLLNPPTAIDADYLRSYDRFNDFFPANAARSEKAQLVVQNDSDDELTPEEQIEKGVIRIQHELRGEVLDRVKQLPPEGFEQLVLRLLVGMGYGGSMADVQGVARGADGGVDGVVNQDHLGLDRIYIQAKRWEGSVGRPVIQGFVGALAGVGASKGVIMTTSTFAQPAQEYVRTLTDRRIVLVDGQRMSDLMLKHGIGVSTKQTFTIQKMDEDFFLEFEV
ncbi:restriction endonuclease [Synechococcus lacustris]|jgi:restriction system protein|uniref:Restriction endonuclease n=1 Tax=Synechococcus lacustris str. Tous TaxID=1910958 RepID=A0A2P7ECG9_9SYNE|nr:restriction endonuclease [Synechococcus lacustris]PSI00912.1 restriction endonuclease [Synechococcus lacustris str. Tous]